MPFRGDVPVLDIRNERRLNVALGFLTGFVSLDYGLTTVSSCFRIWLERAGGLRLRLPPALRAV